MRFAISTPNVGDPSALVELAVLAESNGWDGFFLWDHLHLRRDMHLDVDDPWVVLGACASRTSSLHLGTLVTPLARRRPHVVAKQVTTLDHLTGGKAVFGVGLGVPADEEYGAFGEPTDAKVHAAMLDEGLEVVNGLWSGKPFTHHGTYFTVEGAHFLPRPVQQPRPRVWVAAMGLHRKPLDRAARYDGVVPLDARGEPLTPDVVREIVAAIASRRPLGTLDGFDVVVTVDPAFTSAEYADAGATWLISSVWPEDDWYAELHALASSAPA